ncbi:hypothetical protein [Hydrogenophaga sp.]|uniref:hypothetical protein n=1 Tax=Hydrogenophaga sp. TaxID=1904254 RepID=UPI002FC8162B
MKRPQFNPKMLVAMLAVCAAVAGLASWATGLNFWVLMAIVVAAILINGWVATLEDEDSSQRENDK